MARIRRVSRLRRGCDWRSNIVRRKAPPVIREITGSYADGCNGIIACRTTSLGSLRFDERLPLYGWQEDLDFCVALRRLGRIVRTNLVWGVHLGVKRGKGSEVRLGYSQMVNPAYIVCKGNMSVAYAFQLAARNFLANLRQKYLPGKLCRSARSVAGQLDRFVSLDDRSIDARIHTETKMNSSSISEMIGLPSRMPNDFYSVSAFRLTTCLRGNSNWIVARLYSPVLSSKCAFKAGCYDDVAGNPLPVTEWIRKRADRRPELRF